MNEINSKSGLEGEMEAPTTQRGPSVRPVKDFHQGSGLARALAGAGSGIPENVLPASMITWE